MPFTFRTTLTLAAVAGMAAATAAAIAATRLVSASDARTAPDANPSFASVRKLFPVGDRPDEDINYMVRLLSSVPNAGDLSEEALCMICDCFPNVTDWNEHRLQAVMTHLTSSEETIATTTASLLRALILAGRCHDSSEFARRISAFLLDAFGEIKHPLVQVSDANHLIPCFVAKGSLDNVIPVVYQTASEPNQLQSTALHFFSALLQHPDFSPVFNSLHYASMLWDGIMDGSLDLLRRGVYTRFLSNLMLVNDFTPTDLAHQWVEVTPTKDILELLQSDHECLHLAAYFAITLLYLANQQANAVFSLGDDVVDAYLSTSGFVSCTPSFATLSLCALVSANDAFAGKLLSSIHLDKLITSNDAAGNLKTMGVIQSALVCANVEIVPTIQKLLKGTQFIPLTYKNIHNNEVMPVAIRFLLTFDPDARSKLLALFVQRSATIAADLTSGAVELDSNALSAFMFSVYCFLTVTSPCHAHLARQRLIKDGNLLNILRVASSEPSVRFYTTTYQLAGVMCEDESLIPMIVDAFHRPLLAHLHSSLCDLISTTKSVLDSVRGQPAKEVDNATVDAAGHLFFSTVSWFHHSFSHALNPSVVAALVERPDNGLFQFLDCLKQLLNLNILDSEQRPFFHRNRTRALGLYFARNHDTINSGTSKRWNEMDAYVAFVKCNAMFPSLMRGVCLALSELANYDLIRQHCLDILPTVPALLFTTSNSVDSFYRNLLQAPSHVVHQYYKWIAAHYSSVVQLESPSFATKPNMLVVEALERTFIRNPSVDSVHWASMTGNVKTSVRGTMAFNFSQHQQQLRGSHGVTGKGKYCFTVFSPDESGMVCGWTTYAGPLAWNKSLFKHAQEESQTVVIDYDDVCAWNSGKAFITCFDYRNTITAHSPNSVVTCALDLDKGIFTAALNEMPFHIIFSNLDRSRTWYPVLFPQANTVVDTDFYDIMRETASIPLGLAPASDLIRHPDARSPTPAAVQLSVPVQDYSPIASNGPMLGSEQLADLIIHQYFEAKLTPSSANPALAAGFRMDDCYTLWIGTRQIELAVQFFLQDNDAVEGSVPWRKWIPAVVDHLLQSKPSVVPEHFGVKFTQGNDAVEKVIDPSSSSSLLSQVQLNVCGHYMRDDACARSSFKDLGPICSSPINLGVAIVANKSGSRSFAVTKGLDQVFASDMFPWTHLGQSDIMTPLLINACSVTLNMHGDVQASESFALVGPLIRGREQEDLKVWFENCKN